jgi:hypothetical protein
VCFWFEQVTPVCGNTAAILTNSWLAAHFTVIGDRSRHFGAFRRSANATSAAAAAGGAYASDDCDGGDAVGSSSSSSCCAPASGSGGCC